MNMVFTGLLRVLGMLGFGFLSYQGFSLMIDNLIWIVKTNYQGISGEIFAIVDIAGFTDALGYLLSAVTTKAAFSATRKFMPLPSK